MGKLFKQLAGPIVTIRHRPWDFAVWCFVSMVFGLVGFWLPILLVRVGKGTPAMVLVYRDLLNGGHLGAFTLVLLAEGFAGLFIAIGGSSNVTAAGMRGFFGLFALLVSVVQAGILVFVHAGVGPPQSPAGFQLILTGIAILLACYLYCFRFPAWEMTVEDAKNEEEKEVGALGQAAQQKHADEGGVKL